jgi:hypothetical protein
MLHGDGFGFSAIALKRALDFKAPFDFAAAVRAGPALLVGEGNLSFSLALSESVGAVQNMTASTFKTSAEYSAATTQNAKILRRRGVATVAGVDATNLSRYFGQRKFASIIFQFPNVGSRSPIYGRNPNHILVRSFLKSAAWHLTADLVRHMLKIPSRYQPFRQDFKPSGQFAQISIPGDRSRLAAVLLRPRSVVSLTGAGRYGWTHEIPARKSDFMNGAKVDRGRRISLTFRKVIGAVATTS